VTGGDRESLILVTATQLNLIGRAIVFKEAFSQRAVAVTGTVSPERDQFVLSMTPACAEGRPERSDHAAAPSAA